MPFRITETEKQTLWKRRVFAVLKGYGNKGLTAVEIVRMYKGRVTQGRINLALATLADEGKIEQY